MPHKRGAFKSEPKPGIRVRSLSVRLRFEDAAIHPMHAFVSEDDRYGPTRLLQWNVTSRGTGLMVFQVTGPRDPYTATLDATPNVESYETVSMAGGSGQFAVLVEDAVAEAAGGIFDVYDGEDVVTVPPVVFRTDRSADLQLVGRTGALQELLDRLPNGVDAEVRRVTAGSGARLSATERLTAQQRRVVSAALEAGYYDEPRSATLGDVAERLGLATGTVAEHVRKAEARLVADAVREQ